jgi:hypothetical protein
MALRDFRARRPCDLQHTQFDAPAPVAQFGSPLSGDIVSINWLWDLTKVGCEQEFARGGDLGDFRGAGNFGTLVSCIKMGAEWKNET